VKNDKQYSKTNRSLIFLNIGLLIKIKGWYEGLTRGFPSQDNALEDTDGLV
jgi:hypothetical protein